MQKLEVFGANKLKGQVNISGSKNASLPILAATLLFDQPVIIKNLPRVRDIDTMLNLLKSLGSKIIFSKHLFTVKFKLLLRQSRLRLLEMCSAPMGIIALLSGLHHITILSSS